MLEAAEADLALEAGFVHVKARQAFPENGRRRSALAPLKQSRARRLAEQPRRAILLGYLCWRSS